MSTNRYFILFCEPHLTIQGIILGSVFRGLSWQYSGNRKCCQELNLVRLHVRQEPYSSIIWVAPSLDILNNLELSLASQIRERI